MITATLSPDDLALLRRALRRERTYLAGVSNFASQFLQGSAQTRTLVAVGDQVRDVDALDYRLREAHAEATGGVQILHGNRDIHDPANELTFEQQAQEANARG